jgi:hypothetical protein
MTQELTDSKITILTKNSHFIITVEVSTLVCILHDACLDGICFHLKYPGVKPKIEAMPLLSPIYTHLYTVPSLVLDPSVYQTRPPLLSGINVFCHSCL